MPSITLVGVKETREFSKLAPRFLKMRLHDVAKETAVRWMGFAKQLAPVRTGRLAASYTVSDGDVSSGIRGGSPQGLAAGKGEREFREVTPLHFVVGTNVPYAPKIEAGGATRSKNFFGDIPKAVFDPALKMTERFLSTGKLDREMQLAINEANRRASTKAA